MGYNRAEVEENAKADVVNEIMQAYLQREPHAIKVVHEFFTEAGEDMDSFMASALVQNLDSVERIDRITTMAERRRDNALHEIERRRTALGEALRGAVQEIEDGEFRAIGSIPDNEKNAA
jgi:hypothetical protein